MKSQIISSLLLALLFYLPFSAMASDRYSDPKALKQEITSLIESKTLDLPSVKTQSLVVDFLINAQNEIVVLGVEGEDFHVCEKIKDWLNFRKVKYQQSRQLIRYTLQITLKE